MYLPDNEEITNQGGVKVRNVQRYSDEETRPSGVTILINDERRGVMEEAINLAEIVGSKLHIDNAIHFSNPKDGNRFMEKLNELVEARKGNIIG